MLRDRKFADSSLEGNGFEPLVPQRKSRRFPKHSGDRGRLPPGRMSSRPFNSPTLGSADCPILGSGLPGRRTGGGPDPPDHPVGSASSQHAIASASTDRYAPLDSAPNPYSVRG